jgi:predicted nucleic acid-binding protein
VGSCRRDLLDRIIAVDKRHLKRLLSEYIRYYHEDRDALIAMSAARLGITVITANVRDFMRLAEFRPFQWRVHDFRGS